MQQVVSITTQGQLTIPKALREALGIIGQVKAIVEKRGETLVVTPKTDFWSLSGSLSSSVKLTNKQLKEAREEFSRQWPQI